MSESTDPATVVAILAESFESFAGVLDDLAPEQWQHPSLCPDWTVHGVAVHVAAIETALLGWRPGDEHPFASLPGHSAELAHLDGPALARRCRELFAARLDELAAMSADELIAPSVTPVGPGTYARFMAIRQFDVWVHERDVRVPLGIAGDDGGAAGELALDEVDGSIGYIVGKKIGLSDGTGIAIHLTGPVHRSLLARVDGRAARVEALADPDVTITTDSLTFMLLACGRIDPDEPIRDGRLTWTGDADLADRAARNLAFTM
jgi:uncharacterized protein (TIGR03083 family)